jgi:hypothetical protein
MAEKIKITLEVDESGSIKVVDQLGDKLDDVKKAGEKAADGIESTTKAAKKGESSFKRLGSAIKGGFAVGAVVKGLDLLAQGLMSNQKTQDIFNRAIIVFQGLINGTVEVLEPFFKAIMKAFTSPKEAWDDLVSAFEAGGKWINDNIIDGVLNFFIIRINDLQIGFLKAKKAWNDLTRDFEESAEVQDKINKLTAENSKLTEENGKKVDNIVAVYEKAKNSVVKAANTIKKNTKEAFDNSGAILAAEKNLGRLQIAFQGIVEKYDRQAELQRQIRDDETKTIDERIKANEKLAEVLDEGQKKELENLDEQIAQQQIRLSNNKGNIQIENEILALQAEKTAVEAKYTGLKSEQMVNINGLNKEAIELKRAEMEGTIEANTIMANSDAEMLGDTLEGFRLKKQALQDEFMAKRKAIDDEIAANKEGTAAYVEAVNKKKVLDAQYAADVRTLTKEQQEYIKAAAEKEKETNQAVQDAKMASVMGALAGVQALLGADSKYGKALSVAQAIISTYQGASKALGQGGVFGPVAAAGVIAQGLAQVRSIMSTDLPEAPMGGGGGGGMSMPSGPSVGIIQGQMSQTSQLQAELNSQMRRPTRAYVVGQNVTTQQSLDRHILENATL